MQTAELGRREGSSGPALLAAARLPSTAELARRWAWPALAVVLCGGLALRLWGIRQGLPYAFNADEADHFVPRAVSMFAHGLNPHYFANPPAFTYLLHYLFAIAYGGKAGALRAFALHPTEVYTLARIASAVLGAGSLWLLYLAGARLLGRAVGLLAAAIEAVAFLPTYYAHLALNDVPALAPLSLSLLGSALVLRRGRARDYLLAGLGLGLACATKYTAGIAILPLAAAIAARYLRQDPRERVWRGRRRPHAGVGIVLASTAALGAFVLANPYAVLNMRETEAAARTLGLQVQSVEVRGPDDIETGFSTAIRWRAGAFIVVDDPVTYLHRTRIADLAARNQLPAMYGFRQYAEAGGLMAFGTSLADLSRRAATYVDKILKGAKPADLPVEQPTQFELVINAKTAKALKLTIPPSVLLRADQVIE